MSNITSDSMMFCSYSLGLCTEFIQLFLEKAGSLNIKFMILTILMTFIYPSESAKRSQQQSVSCGGICDFSYSAGLFLYAMFLVLKMVYPAMNLVYWLIPAGTVAIIYVSLCRSLSQWCLCTCSNTCFWTWLKLYYNNNIIIIIDFYPYTAMMIHALDVQRALSILPMLSGKLVEIQ